LKIWTPAILSLITLLFIYAIRITLNILLLTDVIYTNESLGFVIGNLPSILFYFVYTALLFKWIELYHFALKKLNSSGQFTELKPILIIFNGVIFLFFVLMSIGYALGDEFSTVETCYNLNGAYPITTKGTISIIFYMVLGLVSIGLFILYILYGVRILELLRNSSKHVSNQNKKQLQLRKLIRLTVVACICLFVQSIYYIITSFLSARTVSLSIGVDAFTEIVASLAFMRLFYAHDEKKFKLWKTNKSSRPYTKSTGETKLDDRETKYNDRETKLDDRETKNDDGETKNDDRETKKKKKKRP